MSKEKSFGHICGVAFIFLAFAGAIAIAQEDAGVYDPAEFLENVKDLPRPERRVMMRSLSVEQRSDFWDFVRALPEEIKENLPGWIRGFSRSKSESLPANRTPRAIGTLQYDTGTAHGQSVPANNVFVGNRFNTGFRQANGPTATSLQKVSFQLNKADTGITIVVGALTNIPGRARGLASVVTSIFLPPPVTGTVVAHTLVAPVIFAGSVSSIIAGVYQFTTTTIGDRANRIGRGTTFSVRPAVDINSNGFGFYGVTFETTVGGGITPINPAMVATSAPGPGPTMVPLNAIFRVTGNNLPVELTRFTIKEEE